MHWPRKISSAFLIFLSFSPAALRAQAPQDEIALLPTQLAPERLEALRVLSPSNLCLRAAARHRVHPYFFPHLRHPLTPQDVALRESVRALGIDKHRFVHCELKNRAVVTGAIASIGEEGFFVQTGIMGTGRGIRYAELNSAPLPVPAVGAHLKNGLEWTGMIGVCVVLSPLVIILYPLVLAGVIRD